MPNTDPKLLVDSVAELKRRLRDVVSQELELFEAQTGLTPSDIRFRMVETTGMHDAVRRHSLGALDLSFDM